jgi:lipocalin
LLKSAAVVKPAAAAVAPRRANRSAPVRPVHLAPAPAVSTPPVPTTDPVDPAQFAGTYYEQGSVKQFFSIGLVNTKATYSLNPDGTIRVENSGNYFFNRGPKSSIVGSAVPVNETNSALNVGFFGSSPSANPPGNYTILAHAPDYSWVIVSDPSGQSGYILTRDKNIPPQQYQELLTQARALGVRGNITPTVQYS